MKLVSRSVICCICYKHICNISLSVDSKYIYPGYNLQQGPEIYIDRYTKMGHSSFGTLLLLLVSDINGHTS